MSYHRVHITNLSRDFINAHTPTEVEEYISGKSYMFQFRRTEGFMFGLPAPTDTCCQEELLQRGVIGIYDWRRARPL